MDMNEARTIAVVLLIGSIFFSWAEFVIGGLGASVTAGLTPREVVMQGYGWFDAKEVHPYGEYLVKLKNPDPKRTDHMTYIVYKVGEKASAIFVMVLISIGLIAYAGIAHNKHASLAGGVLALFTALYFLVTIASALKDLGYSYSVLDLFTGVPVKYKAFFSEDYFTFRLSWGWYMAVVGALFAIYGGKRKY